MNTPDTTNARAPDRHLRITWLADRAGLRIEGELDRAGLPTLRRVLTSMPSGGTGLCIDLSGLTFIDSGCMRALVNAGAALHKGGGEQVLALGSVPPQMQRLFELIGWDRVPGLRLQAAYPS
ncbi:STAS domain-containing protein [Nonomuraea endophytica]|uniref:STAS domain-containing protein n=1 Tax=Nonomuraea endophytica TaxID=714136 RepID=UPI0037C747EA